MNCNGFYELDEEESKNIDGGIAWTLVALGTACVIAFGIGVYNGIKGDS